MSSGEWCGNGGKSTVLPIEVNGFIHGVNNITFGNSNKNEPSFNGSLLLMAPLLAKSGLEIIP